MIVAIGQYTQSYADYMGASPDEWDIRLVDSGQLDTSCFRRGRLFNSLEEVKAGIWQFRREGEDEAAALLKNFFDIALIAEANGYSDKLYQVLCGKLPPEEFQKIVVDEFMKSSEELEEEYGE